MITTKQAVTPIVKRQDTNPKLLLITCAICFFAVGIPFWIVPYYQVNLPTSLSDISLLVVALAAFLVRHRKAIDFWMGASFVGMTVPGVVMIRIIVETTKDPTSHNLWPFEVIIAAFFGYAYALAGTIAGHFYAKFTSGRSSRLPHA
jgi:hypothetical protein